jgi:hypothetical protein
MAGFASLFSLLEFHAVDGSTVIHIVGANRFNEI